MKKRFGKAAAALLTAVILSALCAMGAGAYFSDYETGLGDITLHLGGETYIEEETYEGNKTISIKNTGRTTVVVRATVLGDLMTVTASDGWEKHGDFWYYTSVLEPDESTSTIKASLTLTEEQKKQVGDTFDVVVVHESAQAIFDENNTVIKPDGWDYIPTIKVD